MKRMTLLLLTLSLSIVFATNTLATCRDTQNVRAAETDSWACTNHVSKITKTVHWKISWLDGYDRDVDVTDYGQLGSTVWWDPFPECGPACWPNFGTPYFEDDGTTAYWYQKTYAGRLMEMESVR